MAESSNAPSGSPRVCIGQQMGQLTELRLKEDDFNAWIERHVSLNTLHLANCTPHVSIIIRFLFFNERKIILQFFVKRTQTFWCHNKILYRKRQ